MTTVEIATRLVLDASLTDLQHFNVGFENLIAAFMYSVIILGNLLTEILLSLTKSENENNRYVTLKWIG